MTAPPDDRETAIARYLAMVHDEAPWHDDPGPHDGDCTNQCHTCIRCFQESYRKQARNIIAMSDGAVREEGRRQGARANPDDIRADGWAVAIHNDYRKNGVAHTFWLFTKGNVCIKGEGITDAEALDEIRRIILSLPLPGDLVSSTGQAAPAQGEPT